MIRHLVLWKLDSSYTAEEKEKIINEMQVQLLALPPVIQDIESLKVFTNAKKAPKANYDIVLDTKFEDFKALDKYQKHPEHVKVVEYIKTLKLDRSAIDYEM